MENEAKIYFGAIFFFATHTKVLEKFIENAFYLKKKNSEFQCYALFEAHSYEHIQDGLLSGEHKQVPTNKTFYFLH